MKIIPGLALTWRCTSSEALTFLFLFLFSFALTKFSNSTTLFKLTPADSQYRGNVLFCPVMFCSPLLYDFSCKIKLRREKRERKERSRRERCIKRCIKKEIQAPTHISITTFTLFHNNLLWFPHDLNPPPPLLSFPFFFFFFFFFVFFPLLSSLFSSLSFPLGFYAAKPLRLRNCLTFSLARSMGLFSSTFTAPWFALKFWTSTRASSPCPSSIARCLRRHKKKKSKKWY